jgi:hypothetical protein
VVGYTGFGSFTVWLDILDLVVLGCDVIYWIWYLYSVMGCTGFGSFTVWDVLVFVVLQCGGKYWCCYF